MMTKSELLTIPILLFTIIVNMGFTAYIIIRKENAFIALKKCMQELFYNRNIFGKILCCFVLLVFLPSIIPILVLQIFAWIFELAFMIWDCGEKKEDNMNSVTIDGKTITYSSKGSNMVVVKDGKVIVDGEIVHEYKNDIRVVIEGDVGMINCNGSVEVHGNAGTIDCGGSCGVNGDVNGDIDAGGSVTCGNVSGDIDAGGSVKCRR